jgi:hypothetical protein
VEKPHPGKGRNFDTLDCDDDYCDDDYCVDDDCVMMIVL